MTTPEIIFTALAAVAPIVSVIVAIIVARHNNKRDIEKDARELGAMISDLGYIKSGIDDLKRSQKIHDEKLDVLTERITKVETSLDAHIRDKHIHNYRQNNKKEGN